MIPHDIRSDDAAAAADCPSRARAGAVAMSRRTGKRPTKPVQRAAAARALDATLEVVQARAPALLTKTPRDFETWLLWLHGRSVFVPVAPSSASSAKTAAAFCSGSVSVRAECSDVPCDATRASARTALVTDTGTSCTHGQRHLLTPARKLAKPQNASYSGGATHTDAAETTPGGPEAITLTCQLCFHEGPANGAVRFCCEHGPYCLHCLQQYATVQLGEGVIQLPCPECKSPLADHEIRDILPPDILDRFHSKSLEQAVLTTSGLFACPTPDCPMRVALEEADATSGCYSCPRCGLTSCLWCKAQPYHEGQTCEEYDATRQDSSDRELRRWMRETGTQQCPTCRMAITKDTLSEQGTQNLECHKMICRSCRTRFCFGCNRVLTDEAACGCTPADHGFVDPVTGAFLAPYARKKQLGTCSTLVGGQGGDANPLQRAQTHAEGLVESRQSTPRPSNVRRTKQKRSARTQGGTSPSLRQRTRAAALMTASDRHPVDTCTRRRRIR